MSDVNNSTNQKTNIQGKLLKHLQRNGVSQPDAELIDQEFSDPNMPADQFIDDWLMIGEILSNKDPILNIPDDQKPKSEPWLSIFEKMEEEAQKNTDVFSGFSLALVDYENRRELQQAITNSVSVSMTIAQEKKQKRGKAIQTKDIKDALHKAGYSFRMNELGGIYEVNEEAMTDETAAEICNQMADLNFPKYRVIDAYMELAGKNKYHPIQDYLNSLTWDSTQYIASLASYFNDSYGMFPVWLRKWLIGAVAKVFKAEQNPMLVLDGRQGIGKSEFSRWLASPMRDYFIEGAINTDDKDSETRLMSYWIWEVSELGATTRKSDIEALKSFLTKRKVTVRKPYGKFDTSGPALASFIGTINNSSGIFSDPTGSRRFITAKLEDINWDYSTDLDPNNIWAEAMAAYLDGESWKLTRDEMKRSNQINEEYDVPDPVIEIIKVYFEIDPNRHDWELGTKDIAGVLKDQDRGNLRMNDNAIYKKIKDALLKLGLEKTEVKTLAGNRGQGYKGIRLHSINPFTSASP